MIKFVARSKELAQVDERFASNRLVTIVGVGGVGKTRLVREFIREKESLFVSLESVQRDVIVKLLDTTIRELESRSTPSIHKTIVILDNAEHLAQRLHAKIDELLGLGCRILVTSREPLRHPLECVVRLLPFDRRQTEVFFRAILTQQNLAIENELAAFNYGAIYTLLDGLPLALEIVAAKLSVLNFREQREFLTNQVFSPQLHLGQEPRTLNGTFEWSWKTLSEENKVLFSRVALFCEPFSRAAANAVCDMNESAVDLALSELLRKSLLRRETIQGKTRFRMLYVIRTFAANKLSAVQRARTMDKIALLYVQELFSTTKLLRKSHNLWIPIEQMFKSPDVSDGVKLKLYRALQSLESVVLDTSFRDDFDAEIVDKIDSVDADFIALDTAQINDDWAAFDRKFEKFVTRPALENAIIVDVLWMVGRFRPESVGQIDALKDRLKNVDDHCFSFWIQEAAFRARYGMVQESEALFERAQHYAEDRNDLLMENIVAVCRGFIALREHRFEDADYFLKRAVHESTPPTAKGHRICVLRRLGKNREALTLAKPFFERVYELGDFHTANKVAWNLFLLTGSNSWLLRASSLREDNALMACCFMYIGLSQIRSDRPNALDSFKKAQRLSVNRSQLGASLALQSIAGEPKWNELSEAWSGTELEPEIATVREVSEFSNQSQISAFLRKEAQRPLTEIHQRHITFDVLLGGFDLHDAWMFISKGWEEKPILNIDFDYSFCDLPDGTRIDLTRRGPMKKILKALVDAHQDHHQVGLMTWQVMEAGWPTDKVRGDAAVARLYTTINNLRKLGFREIIETTDEGYRIRQDYLVRIV